MKTAIITLLSLALLACQTNPTPQINAPGATEPSGIVVGAEQMEEYLSKLQNKRVALVVNHTSLVNGTHLVDTLLSSKVNVVRLFGPEHGFRGQAAAGEKVKDGLDAKTNLPVVSLYGKNKKPSAEQLKGIDIVVFDIQDVGARFYTYISTMTYVMEACAEQGIPLLILDRPNPNRHRVDGPVLQKAQASFIGLHPVPILYGMNCLEYALMVNGEGWLTNGVKCNLEMVKCKNFDSKSRYVPPVAPSPNLRDIKAIYAYPSTCLLEGTSVSEGRGTERPFLLVGHPDFKKGKATFTPVSSSVTPKPKFEGKICKGFDFANDKTFLENPDIDLTALCSFHKELGNNKDFFRADGFFNLLAGNQTLQLQLEGGKTAQEIHDSWKGEIDAFKKIRKKYLLYE